MTMSEEPKACRNCDGEDAVPGSDFCEACGSEETRANADSAFDSLPLPLLKPEQLAWLVVNSLRELAHGGHFDLALGGMDPDELHSLRKLTQAKLKDIEGDPEMIRKAREQYARRSKNNIEIDDDAVLSQADFGTWVQAWVYVEDGINCECHLCELDECKGRKDVGCYEYPGEQPECAADCESKRCIFKEKAHA